MRVYIFYGIVSTENSGDPTEIEGEREGRGRATNGRIADGERRGGERAGGGEGGETVEETEEGEEDARERSEGLRYITRQLPDATVRTNCTRGT
ncbi:hypothetical protein EAG_08296 [Camponotus floridanus]|uniref:Uncharacterized protein n=1 Tax=Camponotus floridanus TaxID=104421 RepID=E2APJ7_CAMFO|nr:hypothetical protein EAG_08296 [Camponotus floridanus]